MITAPVHQRTSKLKNYYYKRNMHSPTFPGILSSKIYLDTLLYTPFFEGEIGDMKYYFVVTKDKQQCMLKF